MSWFIVTKKHHIGHTPLPAVYAPLSGQLARVSCKHSANKQADDTSEEFWNIVEKRPICSLDIAYVGLPEPQS